MGRTEFIAHLSAGCGDCLHFLGRELYGFDSILGETGSVRPPMDVSIVAMLYRCGSYPSPTHDFDEICPTFKLFPSGFEHLGDSIAHLPEKLCMTTTAACA